MLALVAVPGIAARVGHHEDENAAPRSAADESDDTTTVVATADVPRRAIAGLSIGRELRNEAEAADQAAAASQYEAATQVEAPVETVAAEAPTTVATTAPRATTPPTTTPPTTAPAPPVTSGIWDRIAACESGGNWAINSGNGYYGGLQFLLSTWQINGGTAFAAYPHQATREQQITVAERVVAANGGSYGAWGACAASLGLS